MPSRRLCLSECLEGVIAAIMVHQRQAEDVAQPGIPLETLLNGLFRLSRDPRFEPTLRYLDFSCPSGLVYSRGLEEWLFVAGVWGVANYAYQRGRTEVVMRDIRAQSVCQRLKKSPDAWRLVNSLAQELLQFQEQSQSYS